MIREIKHCGFGVLLLVGLVVLQMPARTQGQTERGFDNADYATALETYVDDRGMVNYRKLKANPKALLSYVKAIATLGRDQYQAWGDHVKIAFWLNAYNGLTLKAIIDNYPIKSSFLKSRIYPKNSIRQIPGVWDKIEFTVMGRKVTLEHIEHEILRVEFNEPRIHMAMVCAAMGCPTLRDEPYVGDRLGEQLDDQTHRFLASRKKFRIDRGKRTVYVSPIFKWFAKDFVKTYAPARNVGRQSREGSAVLNFIAGYLDGAAPSTIRRGDLKIKYLDYDWSLNEQKG
ncbi:MAG: DUF547 domain-containing protein [Planctomycetota bacterium]|jgi:hypothetical protein